MTSNKLLNIGVQTVLATVQVAVQGTEIVTKLTHGAVLLADATVVHARITARKKLVPEHFLNDMIKDVSWKDVVHLAHDNDYYTSKLIDGRLDVHEYMNQVLSGILK